MISLTEVLPGEGPRGCDDTLLGCGLLRQSKLVDLPKIAHVDPAARLRRQRLLVLAASVLLHDRLVPFERGRVQRRRLIDLMNRRPKDERRVDGDEVPLDLALVRVVELPGGLLCERLRRAVLRRRGRALPELLDLVYGLLVPVVVGEDDEAGARFEDGGDGAGDDDALDGVAAERADQVSVPQRGEGGRTRSSGCC